MNPSTDLVPANASTLTLIRPVATAAEVIGLHKQITELIGKVLEQGRDYGKIPGTDEECLFKAGAERICIAFGCSPRYEIVEREVEHDRKVAWRKRQKVWRNRFKGDRSFDWKDQEGEALGLYRYVVRCRIEQGGTGRVVAEGIGSCSTMESKYVDRPRDLENTVLKMASKRGFVAATLNAFGLSDRFTQDLEEHEEEAPAGGAEEAPASTGNGTVDRQNLMKLLHAGMHDVGVKDDTRHGWVGKLLGHEIKSMNDCTPEELERVRKHLATLDDLAKALDKLGAKDGPQKLDWLANAAGRKVYPSTLSEAEAVNLLGTAKAESPAAS